MVNVVIYQGEFNLSIDGPTRTIISPRLRFEFPIIGWFAGLFEANITGIIIPSQKFEL